MVFFATFGVTGLSEAVQLLGLDILEDSGQEFVFQILEVINKKIDAANKRFKSPHNCEQVNRYSAINK